MNCTRRNFLIGGSTTLFLSGYFPKISFASMQKKNLIIISLRGGMDGLTAVKPSIPPRSDIIIRFFFCIEAKLIFGKYPERNNVVDPPIKKFLLVQFIFLILLANYK